MENTHVISDEVLDLIKTALSKNEHWMAYNNSLYFIDKSDIHFFKTKEEAQTFSTDNISDQDRFHVIQLGYPEQIFTKIDYPSIPENQTATDLSTLKNTNMNEQNLNYLKDNLKYMGFGEQLHGALEKQLMESKPGFTLKMETNINKQTVEAELHFKKSETTDMYFFNKYDVKIRNEENSAKDLQQSFYLNKGQGVTLKESYNLLQGRSVFKSLTDKEGQPYKAWIQLNLTNKDEKGNFKRQLYHENYGYNLTDALSKYPIKELVEPKEKEKITGSLQKGNTQIVNIVAEAKTEKIFLEAAPKYKDLNMYNAQMIPLGKEEKEKLQIGAISKSQANELDQPTLNKKKEQVEKPETKKEQSAKEKIDKKKENSLLPKKRENHKKGLGIS
jgi:hypothetical protein